MEHMLRRATDRTPLNSVRPEMAKFRTAPNFDENAQESREKTLALVRRAIDRADLKLEYLAGLCTAKTKGRLSEALSGSEHFYLSWLDTWPDEFWREFKPLLSAERLTEREALREQRRQMLHTFVDVMFDEAVS